MKKQSESIAPVTFGAKTVGGEELFFVIEEGQANLGDFNVALAMIDVAATTGADAIEFQLSKASDLCTKNYFYYEAYTKREYTPKQIHELVAYTKIKGLEFIAVPLSAALIDPLVSAGCSGFNINASDITNPSIVDAVVESGLPFFLSLPLATEEEINWARKRILSKTESSFVYLHGQHTMAGGDNGLDAGDTSLGYIDVLKKRYGTPVGYIDHTPHVWMPAMAVTAGADTVSKHLILGGRQKDSSWPDGHVCVDPEEMKAAVTLARKMRRSITTREKVLAPGEQVDRPIMRRSIVAARAIRSGTSISADDIEFKRPGTGIPPARYMDVIGRITMRDLEPDDLISFSDIKEP